MSAHGSRTLPFSALPAMSAMTALLCAARCISHNPHLVCSPSHYGSQHYF
jgi:hypothetical protein